MNARFYRGCDELPSDLVLEFRQLALPLERVDDRFRVLLGLEARDAHSVDALLACLRRKDLGGIARVAQRVVRIERRAGFAGGEADLPFPAARRDTLAGLLLGLRRPFPEFVDGDRRHRLRHVALERVEREALVERERPFAGRRDLDADLDQADDVALLRGFLPEVS